MTDFGRDLVDWLYYGDNLEILSRFISPASVDLVYLDPPFNKNAAYSVIFRDETGRTSDAQIATLEDYWHWGPTPASHYEYLTNSSLHGVSVPQPLAELIAALHAAIRPSPLLAYLVEMAVRLVKLRQVLKPTGSLWLHCDPTASHYLKLLLDAIFGPEQFRAEVIWRRSDAHNNVGQGQRRLGRVHDVLLYYSVSSDFTFNIAYTPLPEATAATWYRHIEPETGRRYNLADMTAPGGASPEKRNPHYEFLGVTRYWRYSQTRMSELFDQGRVVQARPGNVPQLKRYLDESKGVPLQDVWTDIPMVRGRGHERLGYPTQKPIALLERIIQLSSHPGDVVLDPFCGCGTVFAATRRTGRHRIGIDISDFAVGVIRDREAQLGEQLNVFDWPTEMDGVLRMIATDPTRRRFEDWVLTRLGLPINRRGGDGGLDGRIVYTERRGRQRSIIVSVKSARPRPHEVRDLIGTVETEKAVMGLLVTADAPTGFAAQKIHEAGFYTAANGRRYPKIVVHTAEDILAGRAPDLPTRLAIQEPLWPVPSAVRSVRLRPHPAGQGARKIPKRRPNPGEPIATETRRRGLAVGPASPSAIQPEPARAVESAAKR